MQEEQVLELISAMRKKWGEQLNKKLESIKFIQTEDTTLVKFFFKSSSGRIRSTKTDLFFITRDFDDPYFNPDVDIVDNATAFINLDVYTLLNCFEGIFNKADENRMLELYQTSFANEFNF